MNPVDSNAENGFISVSYPLDLVNQAREVMLGANQELFSANVADISSDPPTEFSQLSFQLTSRLDGFSELLSSTDFFSELSPYQDEPATEETENSTFSESVEALFSNNTDTNGAFSASDLKAQEESVKTVIEAYNELVEWLDSSQYAINPSFKADLFKDMNSQVLESITSNKSPAQENAPATRVDGTAPQARQTESFSPQVVDASDETMESALSGIGLTLNTDGTLNVEKKFDAQFQTDVSRAYDVLAGKEGFFTKIGSAIDKLNSRDSRFDIYTQNDNAQVYTRDAGVQVRNIYRTNIASLLNIFA
ncbi:flagellar filament capping protein FliD [uncultured Desulfobacter sp.]|uniref:flagellar filament capping protein FliD n=1 Tax=uncultured Desulfobacter sp. TaxID=240139 RepID=UPI0029F59C38|nr:flagellar filament capping protein FliD [uncultured Desulfobacter sp.]